MSTGWGGPIEIPPTPWRAGARLPRHPAPAPVPTERLAAAVRAFLAHGTTGNLEALRAAMADHDRRQAGPQMARGAGHPPPP